jgi:hypothetical protein
MRCLAILLTMSVFLGCAGTTARDPNSPDDENNEEVGESPSEDSERAQADEDGEERKGTRPAKKRKPKRRKHVEAAAEVEPPPMYRKPIPPPAAPPPEEPEPEPELAPAYTDNTEQGDTALEAEARKRCHWKNVAPYRPDWANHISPPLGQQRKITSKPICPYGTPPAVVRVARQIAVQQTKLKRR